MQGGPFGAPQQQSPFGAPATQPSPFGAPQPTMGATPMMGGMAPPAQNGPSANPFLSGGGGGAGMFGAPAGGMGAPMGGAPMGGAPIGGSAFGGPDPMSNGFGTLEPAPAPGTEDKSKAKSVDPLFGDLVNSFGADLGQKKKDEFFKSGPGPKMNDMMPQSQAAQPPPPGATLLDF